MIPILERSADGVAVDRKKGAIKVLSRIYDKLDDHVLAIRLRAAVAVATKDRADFCHATNLAAEYGFRNDRVAQAAAVMVRILARLHRFQEARNVRDKMLEQAQDVSTFWCAEACSDLLEFSADADDKNKAKEALGRVRGSHARLEAKDKFSRALKSPCLSRPVSFAIDLEELGSVLSQLEAFEDSHVVAPKKSGANLRLLAEEIIDRIFAKVME